MARWWMKTILLSRGQTLKALLALQGHEKNVALRVYLATAWNLRYRELQVPEKNLLIIYFFNTSLHIKHCTQCHFKIVFLFIEFGRHSVSC
jgi:hypothetical protein